MTDIDAALVQQVFNISQGERESDVLHHGKTDYLRRRTEIAEWVGFCHPANVGDHLARLNLFPSDSAHQTVATLEL